MLLVVLGSGLVACQSSGPKKRSADQLELGRLGALEPDSEVGSYYKLRRTMNGFYHNIPIFTQVLPDRFLMRGHVVQLLDSTAGDGWARVKNEQLQVGYVQFTDIKIVPREDQPHPPVRDENVELDMRMRAR